MPGGLMISVGIKELKEKLSGYVDKVRHGEEIVVTDRGKEIALVVPISRERGAVKGLVESGKAKWTGGKPAGSRGIKVKGKSLSRTVLEERR
jgi:prevent-host-death family protein